MEPEDSVGKEEEEKHDPPSKRVRRKGKINRGYVDTEVQDDTHELRNKASYCHQLTHCDYAASEDTILGINKDKTSHPTLLSVSESEEKFEDQDELTTWEL